MILAERSYSTKSFRPRPTIHTEPDGSLLVVTTSWGEPGLAAQVNEDIAKYVQAAAADVEVTSPFEFMTSLGNEANYLRVATLICNESIYRRENRSEYVGGVELLALYRRGHKIAYVQVGVPHVLIQREGQGVVPLVIGAEVPHENPPLPQHLLGIDASVNIRCGEFRVEETDRLILYAGAAWPETLWRPTKSNDDLDQVAQKIVQKNPEAPFWLGLLSL
jgi:hypothetical protein